MGPLSTEQNENSSAAQELAANICSMGRNCSLSPLIIILLFQSHYPADLQGCSTPFSLPLFRRAEPVTASSRSSGVL